MKRLSEVATFQGFNDPPVKVSELAESFNLHKPISLLNLIRLCNARASKDSMTPLLLSGSPGIKIDIAVLGDGFTAGDDQIKYSKAVKDLLINGLFKNDFFLERKSAFNIYRVNLISQDSGVGTKTYDNGNLISTVTKNTALGIYYNGSWSHCWLEDGPNTGTLINNALNHWVPDHNIIMILLNNPGFGGCGGGGRLTLPLGVTWDTIAHEFGHALGNLGDEYCAIDETYTGSEPSYVNVTINTNKETLKWKKYIKFIDNIPPIPTGIGKCAGYNQGTEPSYWDHNQSVGLFEGGNHYYLGVYRPVINCRMRGNLPPYCPVCYAQMKSVTSKYMGTDKMQNAGEQKETSEGYVRLKIHMEDGKLSVTDAKEIPGPYITQTDVNLGYNYEVLTDDKSISLGFLPDVGIRRSFANIDAPGLERREHITILPSFDFFVRIPKSQISKKTLPRMTIAVHEVKQTPDKLLKAVPLTKQTGLMSTEVGRMNGIKMDEVPKEVSSQLERILKENEEQK